MEDEFMDVYVNGELEKRRISHIEKIDGYLSKLVPELRDGEDCIWFLGSLIPRIITVRASC